MAVDRHKKKCHVSIELGATFERRLQAICKAQSRTAQSACEEILVTMLEATSEEVRFRLGARKLCTDSDRVLTVHDVRLSGSVYYLLRQYADENSLPICEQANRLVQQGLEPRFNQCFSGKLPLRKEEAKRRIGHALSRQGRLEDIRFGLWLVWLAVTRR